MEKFKIVERETKTKAYSKEGLTSGQKLDPKEREREEISQWLNQCLETLNIQIDQFEAEIEAIGTTKKKKGRNDAAEQVEQLNNHLEKHRDHVQKLETLLRMLDNDTVEISQIKDIKEDVEYYIENCQDPEFIENDALYDDIDGLEEMLLDVSNVSSKPCNMIDSQPTANHFLFQLGGHEHNTNSIEASETMSTNSASSPIPYLHNHSNDLSNDISEKRRHKSSSEESKVALNSFVNARASPQDVAFFSQDNSLMQSSSSIGKSAVSLPSSGPPPAKANSTSTTSPATSTTPTSNVLNNKAASTMVSATAVAAAVVASSTPIKAGFSTMVASNTNNSSPSSGALNGSNGGSISSSNGAPIATSSAPASLASAVTSVAVSALSATSTTSLLQQQSQPPRQEQQQQPNFAAAVQQLNGRTFMN